MYLDNGLGEPENFLNFKIEPFPGLCVEVFVAHQQTHLPHGAIAPRNQIQKARALRRVWISAKRLQLSGLQIECWVLRAAVRRLPHAAGKQLRMTRTSSGFSFQT